MGRLPIIEARGAAAAMTRKTMRGVESEALSFVAGEIGGLVIRLRPREYGRFDTAELHLWEEAATWRSAA